MHVLFILINLALQNEVVIDQVILFMTTQDYLRTSRRVILKGWSQPFPTRPPKCNTVYWVWETFEWAHNQCVLPVFFMNSKHPIAWTLRTWIKSLLALVLCFVLSVCLYLSAAWQLGYICVKKRYARLIWDKGFSITEICIYKHVCFQSLWNINILFIVIYNLAVWNIWLFGEYL